MEEIAIMDNVKNIDWEYDNEADVLYLSMGEPRPASGLDIGDGVVVRYDDSTKQLLGLTIIGMKQKMLSTLRQ